MASPAVSINDSLVLVVIIVKPQKDIYDTKCVVDPRRLIHKRTKAEQEVEIELNYIIALMKAGLEDLGEATLRINNSI